MDWIGWLEPWEFSPTLLLCFLVCGVLFVRGQRASGDTRQAMAVLERDGDAVSVASYHA